MILALVVQIMLVKIKRNMKPLVLEECIPGLKASQADRQGNDLTLVADMDVKFITSHPNVDVNRIGKHQLQLYLIDVAVADKLDRWLIVHHI